MQGRLSLGSGFCDFWENELTGLASLCLRPLLYHTPNSPGAWPEGIVPGTGIPEGERSQRAGWGPKGTQCHHLTGSEERSLQQTVMGMALRVSRTSVSGALPGGYGPSARPPPVLSHQLVFCGLSEQHSDPSVADTVAENVRRWQPRMAPMH